jgi:predicted transcriptional regulator
MSRKKTVISVELEPTTARHLKWLAETWEVSEEEAIRRAVEQANDVTALPDKESWLEAFKALQRSLDLTPAKAAEWQNSIRDARR